MAAAVAGVWFGTLVGSMDVAQGISLHACMRCCCGAPDSPCAAPLPVEEERLLGRIYIRTPRVRGVQSAGASRGGWALETRARTSSPVSCPPSPHLLRRPCLPRARRTRVLLLSYHGALWPAQARPAGAAGGAASGAAAGGSAQADERARAERAERSLREKEQELQQEKREHQQKTRELQNKTRELDAAKGERDAAKAEVARLRGTGIGCLSVEELKQLKSDIKSAHEEGTRRVEQELKRREVEKALEETNDLFVCPVSQALMKDPVVAADGYTYERASIEEWIRQAGGRTPKSPSTNLPLANTSLTPSHTFKSAIFEAVDNELSKRKRAREGAEGEGDGGGSARPASRPRRRGR